MQLLILVGQVEGNLLKSGRLRPDNNIIATPLLLRFGLVCIFSSSELVRKQISLSGFPRAGNKPLLSPPIINAILTLETAQP